jgi:cytoskeleton protein RodZ
MAANAKEAAQDIRKEWGLPDNAPVGEILRRARGHYNLEISDVEAALRIRASQLDALEQGRFDQLPGRVYAIGFVRAYAEYLGLDGHEMVEIFKKQSGGGSRKPELHFPATASESKVPNFFILAGSFVALVAVLAGFVMFSGQGGGVSEIPDVPRASAVVKEVITGQAPLESAMMKALETATVVAPSVPVAGAPGQNVQAILNAPGVITVPSATPPAPPPRIVIRVTDAAWVEVRDEGGKALLSRILKAGDIYDVPDQPGMTLATGNAGALAMVIDGQPPVLLGAKGDIKRRVLLDADVLKTSLAGNPVVDLPPRPVPQAPQVQPQPQQPVAEAAPAQSVRSAAPRPVRRTPQPEPYPPVIRTPN